MSHVFLLFGASRGIGAACARSLFALGGQVCLAARDADQLEIARSETGPSAFARVTDITEADSVQTTVDAVLETYGKIDTVINFAAWAGPLNRPTWGVAPNDWNRLIQTNATGPYNIIRSCLPPMQDAEHGTLLFASSPFGDTPVAGMGGYSPSRAAAHALVHQLAAELQGSQIGAALVYPGLTDTDGLAAFRRAREGNTMGGQVATAAEMAGLFVWAAMQTPWDINGAVLSWSDPAIHNAVRATN